ncbi:MAG TPA: hypothetical protein VM123_16005 [archaeon]|nr:hypothetical protein [archaeon]
MKFTLDGQKINTAEFNAVTLSELISNLETMVAPERVIISISLDGENLDQKQEKAKASVPLENLESLEIHTQYVDELARNTLLTLIDYLPGLIENVKECASLLQGVDESRGHRNLGLVIDGLQMASAAWNGIAYFINIESKKPQELMPDMDDFYNILQSIVQAQETGDTVLLCDILEFKLVPTLESWLEDAAKLRDL